PPRRAPPAGTGGGAGRLVRTRAPAARPERGRGGGAPAGKGPAGWAGPDTSDSEADEVGHLARLRGLVGGQDHAEHADALDLVVDRALTGHQAVHEVCDLGPEGVHALVLEDLLLLTAHVHAQGGAV